MTHISQLKVDLSMSYIVTETLPPSYLHCFTATCSCYLIYICIII